MSFEGKISGSLAPQGAKLGSVSGSIGAVVPDIRDESVTTAKLADAAVTIAKLAQDVTALINSKGDASDVAQLQSDVAALQTITEGLGTASTYGVANNLTTAAAGTDVLDAYQGKVLSDTLDGKLSSDNVVIQSGHSIYEYVRTMTGGTYAFIRAQNASDNPAGTGLVCYCIAYSPGNNGAYATISAFASAQTYMSNQLSPSATSITWNRTDSRAGAYVNASGKYTTAQWTYGTTTCSLTIPSDGIWIVWGCFEMDNTANRNMYRQLQMQIQGSGSSWLLGVNNIYYDATGTNSNDGIVRTVCAPGNLKSGAVIRPYVHTGDTGVVFTVRLVALRVA